MKLDFYTELQQLLYTSLELAEKASIAWRIATGIAAGYPAGGEYEEELVNMREFFLSIMSDSKEATANIEIILREEGKL